jgi:phosphonate transport system ATP-binding protein
MITIKDAGVTYPGGTVGLRPVTIDFRSGEFTVLIGSSGAGKSTLLRLLNLLTRPTEGKLFSQVSGDLGCRFRLREHRKQTAMIFQQHQLIRRYTALRNVLMGRLGHYGTWRSLFPLKRADYLLALESLDRVGLISKANTRVDALSGGQQQRVGIARALTQRPRLILADEPVASLDPATAHQILSLLRQVCREDGITAVVSLHQVEFALSFADRIIGLAKGEILFDREPARISPADLNGLYNQNEKGNALPGPSAVPSLEICGAAA